MTDLLEIESTSPPKSGRRPLWIVLAVISLNVLMIAGMLNRGDQPEGPGSAEVAGRQETLGDPPEGSGPAEFIEGGWIRFEPLPALPQYEVPAELWVAWVDDLSKVEGRLPLVAAPDENAEIVGYYYLGLGYVPADVADAGQFDEAAVRAEQDAQHARELGCETLDAECITTAVQRGVLEE